MSKQTGSDLERRNRLILDDVRSALAEGRSPILLTERQDHLELLAAGLQSAARHVIVLRGGMTPTERRAAATTLASIPDGESRLLIATGRYIGEGFDDSRLDTLFLAMPVSWKGTLVQYAGRLHRLHPGKTEVRIYDYVDRDAPMLAGMFEKRLRGYRAIGYVRDSGSPPRRKPDDARETFDIPEARMRTSRKRKTNRPRKTRLNRLVEEAIVDCYNESEQVAGVHTMIEDNLALPRR